MERLGQQPEKQPKRELLILTPLERLKALGWKALEAYGKSSPYYAIAQAHAWYPPENQTEEEKLERLYSPDEDEEHIIRGEN